MGDEIPEEVEKFFHDYDKVCEHCMIKRKYDPALVDCPKAQCDNSGDEAFQKLLTNDCLSDCSTEICATNFRILRTEHDNCDNHPMSESAEKGLHSYEEKCEEQNCNLLSED